MMRMDALDRVMDDQEKDTHACTKSLGPRRARGFSLMEILIVIAVIGVLLAIAGKALLSSVQTTTNVDLVAQQAREMDMVASAASKYIKANSSGWALNSRNVITVNQLVTAGFLPTAFGDRFGSTGNAGRTPFGATYQIVAVVDSTNASTIRTVITETGSALASQLSKANVESAAVPVQGLKQTIAQKVQTTNNRTTGYMPQGDMVARASMGSFTKDLTTWIQTAPAQAEAVVFMGFPELGDTCSTPPCPPPGTGKYQDCQVVKAYSTPWCTPDNVGQLCGYGYGNVNPGPGAGTFTQPTCPAGKIEVGSFPFCSNFAISSTDVGTLTSAARTESGVYTDNCGGATGHPYSDNFTDTTLNNVTINTDQCGGQRQYQQIGPPTCLYQLGYTAPNKLITQAGGRNLLCCVQR